MLDKREVERWERLTDAMLRHAAQDDPEAFAQVVRILDRAVHQVPVVAQTLVGELDDPAAGRRDRYSWADLARALGVSRQALHRRYSRKPGRNGE